MAVQQRAAEAIPPTRPFDVDLAVERLREAVRPLPKAAMFQLADEGFDSLFEQIVACIISIRTYEETTLPTARRLYRLGGALGRAIASYPKDQRIVVFGTGGLTHQLHGSKFGTKNVGWDNEFMDRLETDPAGLSELSIQEYMERGGTEGIEMINWLPMRSALGPSVKRVQRTYHAPMITGYGLLALAPD